MIRLTEVAAVRLGRHSPIHSTHPHRLCLSLVMYAAYEPRSARDRRRRHLHVSFVDKERFDAWAAVLADAVRDQQSCSGHHALTGKRVRLLSSADCTLSAHVAGISGVAEAFNSSTDRYMVRLDVSGELVTLPLASVEAFVPCSPTNSSTTSEEAGADCRDALATSAAAASPAASGCDLSQTMVRLVDGILFSSPSDEQRGTAVIDAAASAAAVADDVDDALFHTLPTPAELDGSALEGAATPPLPALCDEPAADAVNERPAALRAAAEMSHFFAVCPKGMLGAVLPASMEVGGTARRATAPVETSGQLEPQAVRRMVELPVQAERGVTPKAESAAAEEVPSDTVGGAEPLSTTLRHLIESLRLGPEETTEALSAARAWCASEGFDDASEVREVGAESELVAALHLKPGKARLLRKRLDDLAFPSKQHSSGCDDLPRSPPEASVVSAQLPDGHVRFESAAPYKVVPVGLPIWRSPTPSLATAFQAHDGTVDWQELASAYERAASIRDRMWEANVG